jgi:hypothetical protein
MELDIKFANDEAKHLASLERSKLERIDALSIKAQVSVVHGLYS